MVIWEAFLHIVFPSVISMDMFQTQKHRCRYQDYQADSIQTDCKELVSC